MKLSKQQKAKHEMAEKILQKDQLNLDEKYFVYNNWVPAHDCKIDISGAFFTPVEYAHNFAFLISGKKIIELCAGIGCLSFVNYCYKNDKPDITCIEINPEFVEVGKKLLPEAHWICGDILDENLIKSLGNFDHVYANPPFGNIKCNSSDWLKYHDTNFEFKAVEVGSYLADYGTFILPQQSLPFKYSGNRFFEEIDNDKYKKFNKLTGIELEMNCGIDVSEFKDAWLGTTIETEIAECNYR